MRCVAAVPYLPDLIAVVHEWCRVACRAAVLVFASLVADGISASRHSGSSAKPPPATTSRLPDPNADLGIVDRIARTFDHLGLRVDRIERRAFPDPFEAEAKAANEHVLTYGCADQLRTAPAG